MKQKVMLAVILVIFGTFLYMFKFKSVDNDYIFSYGWKGGGCDLPDVLDFRTGALRLDKNNLYRGNELLGHITQREYRFYAASIIDIQTKSGEVCRYWAIWAKW